MVCELVFMCNKPRYPVVFVRSLHVVKFIFVAICSYDRIITGYFMHLF